MFLTFLLISYSVSFQQYSAIPVEVCKKTDLLYCYYAKDQGVCLRDENNSNLDDWRDLSISKNTKKEKMTTSSRLSGLYRPRSALARALYEKQLNDRYLQEFDHSEWYRVDKSKLDAELQEKFVQLDPDEETKEFLSASIEKSTWVWTQLWYLLAKAILKHFWSITDINGWLGRGSMFVLSQAQARLLLDKVRKSEPTEDLGDTLARGSVVDIGAGDGEVSRRFTKLYNEQYATEISASMRKALGKKGYRLLDVEDWWRGQSFDCVCMMNLLDRCSKPRTMLRQARTAIQQHGVLLLALVLPYKPYVEVNADHKPEERLPINGPLFEDQVAAFVKFMREEIGFELVSWTRAPYLCEGDFSQAYYWLDDSVYVFKPTAIPPHT